MFIKYIFYLYQAITSIYKEYIQPRLQNVFLVRFVYLILKCERMSHVLIYIYFMIVYTVHSISQHNNQFENEIMNCAIKESHGMTSNSIRMYCCVYVCSFLYMLCLGYLQIFIFIRIFCSWKWSGAFIRIILRWYSQCGFTRNENTKSWMDEKEMCFPIQYNGSRYCFQCSPLSFRFWIVIVLIESFKTLEQRW